MILQVLGIGFGLRSPRPLAAAVGELGRKHAVFNKNDPRRRALNL
jgi:hypothetical protein